MVGGGGGGGDNKVVATLRADGSVYPASGTSMNQLANLMNYKIRTEVDVSNKSLNTFSVPTTVVDLGKQLLQYARDGDLKGVKNMLSRGAPFTSDWLGMSALHFAAMNNQYEVCDTLLKGGINKDSKTKVDRTPLHMACFYGNERIVELLLSKKCAVNPRDMLRMTPLHWAVEKCHKSIVRLLLKNNADVTVTSKFGKTPIALAVLTEQADLLEELEAAKQSQLNRKYNEENEKETSEAVNSIMGLTTFDNGDVTALSKMNADTEDELTNNSDFADAKMPDFDNIKESGVLDKSTINLLKSHGISMMPEDDDASKELLTTALRNGRQLVLSEGGKLLLNETKKVQNVNNNNNISANNSNTNASNKNFTVLPVRGALTTRSAANKTRGNIISKSKDNLNMYKNVRIISLNDFKKFYGNSNLKAMQKIPASVANARMVRQLGGDAKQLQNTGARQIYMNPRHLPQRQMKLVPPAPKAEQSNIIKEDDVDSIIQLAPTDSETEMSDTEQQQNTLPHQTQQVKAPTIIGNAALRVEQISTVPPPMRQLPSLKQITTNTSRPVSETAKQQQQPASTVISLLSVPEICRQLHELRRQNDELRRKFDVAQKEKEELRQRLDRLEELLLVEKTDDDYTES